MGTPRYCSNQELDSSPLRWPFIALHLPFFNRISVFWSRRLVGSRDTSAPRATVIAVERVASCGFSLVAGSSKLEILGEPQTSLMPEQRVSSFGQPRLIG